MSTADETADGAPAPAKAKAKAVPSLEGLCVSAFVRQWHPSRSLEALGGPPRGTELAKKLWAALKAEQAKLGEPITCAAMYPFVRTCWQIEALDLSDGGKWLLDLSLGALRYAPSLRSVRLTACRFVSDDGLAFAPQLQLHTLDVSWTQARAPHDPQAAATPPPLAARRPPPRRRRWRPAAASRRHAHPRKNARRCTRLR